MSPSSDPPRVSVIVPLYRSQETLAACLAALAVQTFPSFEVVTVDSSPDDASQRIVDGFPQVRSVRSRERLLPHAARNAGVAASRGELLVFTDPDVYPEPDWIAALVEAHESTGAVVVAGLACHGNDPTHLAMHWTKFSKWVPAGPRRAIDMAPTAGVLCSRADYEAVAGFPGDEMLGDLVFSWKLLAAGRPIVFEPAARARHHHLGGWRDLIRERSARGEDYARLRIAQGARNASRAFGWLLATGSGARLLTNLAHTVLHARRAGRLGELARVAPLVAVGHGASLWGEAKGYARIIRDAALPTRTG